jgi:Uncharacterized conserved protein
VSIIALLTDFGTKDSYVAAVKGVLASRCDATLLDLSHEITPFDVFEAWWFLRNTLPYLPVSAETDPSARCIVVAVIDPGVGSDRRLLAARIDGRVVLAPDNGLLSLLVNGGTILRSIENEELFLPGGSTTFQGRDRFAPVAAALANGMAMSEVGPVVPASSIVKLDYSLPSYSPEKSEGAIVAIDRFGNLVTDLEVSKAGDAAGRVLIVGHHRIDRLASCYAAIGDGAAMVIGSNGTIEISVANASAALLLRVARLERVELARESKANRTRD